VAWLGSTLIAEFPIDGLMLHMVRVVVSIGLAAIVFYWSCRVLKIVELDEAIDAIAGRFLRLMRK